MNAYIYLISGFIIMIVKFLLFSAKNIECFDKSSLNIKTLKKQKQRKKDIMFLKMKFKNDKKILSQEKKMITPLTTRDEFKQ